jgi:hypothetical protein
MSTNEDKLKTLIGHAKEYGFVFQSSEIYDGLSATYDYGPYGVELKNNIKSLLVEGHGANARKHRGPGLLPSSCTPSPGRLPATWMLSTIRSSTTRTAKSGTAPTSAASKSTSTSIAEKIEQGGGKGPEEVRRQLRRGQFRATNPQCGSASGSAVDAILGAS